MCKQENHKNDDLKLRLFEISHARVRKAFVYLKYISINKVQFKCHLT